MYFGHGFRVAGDSPTTTWEHSHVTKPSGKSTDGRHPRRKQHTVGAHDTCTTPLSACRDPPIQPTEVQWTLDLASAWPFCPRGQEHIRIYVIWGRPPGSHCMNRKCAAELRALISINHIQSSSCTILTNRQSRRRPRTMLVRPQRVVLQSHFARGRDQAGAVHQCVCLVVWGSKAGPVRGRIAGEAVTARVGVNAGAEAVPCTG